MTRVAASGATETTFGSSGVRWVPICDGATGCSEDDTDRGFALAEAPGGELVVAGSAVRGTESGFAIIRVTAEGALDTAFGLGTGWAYHGVGGCKTEARAVLVQPDGAIVAVGWSVRTADSVETATLSRSAAPCADATCLDPTFGAGGIVNLDFGTGLARCRAVGHQSTGKLICVGFARRPGGTATELNPLVFRLWP
jgi:uncharacterized delta-60 repeat protein